MKVFHTPELQPPLSWSQLVQNTIIIIIRIQKMKTLNHLHNFLYNWKVFWLDIDAVQSFICTTKHKKIDQV